MKHDMITKKLLLPHLNHLQLEKNLTNSFHIFVHHMMYNGCECAHPSRDVKWTKEICFVIAYQYIIKAIQLVHQYGYDYS